MTTETKSPDAILPLIAEEVRLRNLALKHDRAGNREARDAHEAEANALFDRIKAAEPTSLENAAALLQHTEGMIQEVNERVVTFLQRQRVPAVLPIATVPKIKDALLLLFNPADRHWHIGYWNGETWYDEDHATRLSPTYWALLPTVPGMARGGQPG